MSYINATVKEQILRAVDEALDGIAASPYGTTSVGSPGVGISLLIVHDHVAAGRAYTAAEALKKSIARDMARLYDKEHGTEWQRRRGATLPKKVDPNLRNN